MKKNRKSIFLQIENSSKLLHAIWPCIFFYILILKDYLYGYSVVRASSSFYFILYDQYIALFISALVFFKGLYDSSKDKINSICGMLILTGMFCWPISRDYINNFTFVPSEGLSLEWYLVNYNILSATNLIYLGLIIFLIKKFRKKK